MKLHHTVLGEGVIEDIFEDGLKPYIADAYKDLVPEKIRHLPVVWFAEGIWQSKELPCLEVDSDDLDTERLFPINVVYEVDKTLNWWVYQGMIPSQYLTRIQ